MYPFPEHVAPALVLLIAALISQFQQAVPGAVLKPYQGHRSRAEQAALFAQGRHPLDEVNRLRTKAGLPPIGIVENKYRITLANPNESLHVLDPSPAVDVVVVCRGKEVWVFAVDCDRDGRSDYMEMGLLAENLGLEWGGRWLEFPDIGHLELGTK
jgi:peptidoglycan L-alanyl-D-glutamate endopeptidase CwlK